MQDLNHKQMKTFNLINTYSDKTSMFFYVALADDVIRATDVIPIARACRECSHGRLCKPAQLHAAATTQVATLAAKTSAPYPIQ